MYLVLFSWKINVHKGLPPASQMSFAADASSQIGHRMANVSGLLTSCTVTHTQQQNLKSCDMSLNPNVWSSPTATSTSYVQLQWRGYGTSVKHKLIVLSFIESVQSNAFPGRGAGDSLLPRCFRECVRIFYLVLDTPMLLHLYQRHLQSATRA